jgi:hypothetical protein
MTDDMQIQTDWDQSSGSCMISVLPRNIPDMRYRNLLWDQNGLLMVFNSFGQGPDSQTTGARDYYLFPRLMMPSYRQQRPGTLDVRTASGDVFTFDSNTAELTSFTGGSVQVAPTIDPSNQGGFEIPSYHGLLLDCGFALGNQPEANLNGVSEFRDAFGARCEVKNSEVFALNGNDVELKFTDSQLHDYLQTRCPLLNALDLVHP